MRDLEKYRLGNTPRKIEETPKEDQDDIIQRLVNIADDHFVDNADQVLFGITTLTEKLLEYTSENSFIRAAMLRSLYGQDNLLNLNGLFTLF
jgi:hypothetical protein